MDLSISQAVPEAVYIVKDEFYDESTQSAIATHIKCIVKRIQEEREQLASGKWILVNSYFGDPSGNLPWRPLINQQLSRLLKLKGYKLKFRKEWGTRWYNIHIRVTDTKSIHQIDDFALLQSTAVMFDEALRERQTIANII